MIKPHKPLFTLPNIFLLALLAMSANVVDAAPHALYVSTAGNDNWSGTLPEPNAAKTDGPLATLERARDAVRALKKQGLPEGGVVVTLRGGCYERSGPLELTADDSGTESSPIIYRGAEGEQVVISGGKRITGFKPVSDPAVLERLEAPARGKILQADLRALGIQDLGDVTGNRAELYYAGKPMTVARWPNDGFVKIVDLVGGNPVDVRGTKGDRHGKFMYEGDRPSRWIGENDGWVHGYWFWDWSDQRHKIESIDTKQRILSVQPPYHSYGYRKGQWFYAFNLLSEIDSPGEWYLDREAGVLYFWPPGPIDEGQPTLSVASGLVTLKNASHVTIRGITFEAARGTALTISEGEQVEIAGCTLRNLGGWAVRLSGGRQSGVQSCDIYRLGGGGVSLSGGDRKSLTPAGHYAVNNHIHDYGLWDRMYQPAVAINGVGIRVAHNLIHDAPHMAVSFGGNDHLIELNEIHHVCFESNDAGAIYAGRDWTMRGTVIRRNFMHHVTGFENRGCVGVYLDDMFCGTTISENVFYDVTRAAFIGGGRDNVVENNVFVDCKPALHIDARAQGWAAGSVATTMTQRLKAMPYLDPLWRNRYPRLVDILDDDPAAPKGNLVARNVSFGGKWDGVQKAARQYVTFEDNLIDEDPSFVDAGKMNFQLQPDSPVYTKVAGFRKIPFDEIGLVEDAYRTP
ncbi:MAG: hypothetical protein GXY83_30565 [Rhodopirellula sp.]|nr:hypothetical protein [Rhodopirellula sp.]